MTASASKLIKTLKLKGTAKVDNKALAAGALTARTNLSLESADNGVNLEVPELEYDPNTYVICASSHVRALLCRGC